MSSFTIIIWLASLWHNLRNILLLILLVSIVPSPPSSVQCHMTTGTTVTIKWTAPEMPNGDLRHYIVDTYLFNGVQFVKSNQTDSIAETFEVTGLLPGK